LAWPSPAAGCIPAPDLAALAADHNAICIRVTTPWGTSEVSRNHGCEPAASIPTTSSPAT